MNDSEMKGSEVMGTTEDTITISKKEYHKMQHDLLWLEALEQAGVDNWEGIDFAHEIYSIPEGEG